MITQFLDPKNNYVFWQIFGTDKNKDVLVLFLNDILEYKDNQKILEVEYLPTAQDPEIAVYRQSIIDVLCKDIIGTQFIVEMQVSAHDGFEKRAQFYAAKAYSRQILTEDDDHKKMAVYAKLQGVIFIAIANFIMFPEKNEWKSTHRILDTKTYENDLKDFCFKFLELPKFKKKIDELDSIQEKWAYFFKYAHKSSLADINHLIGEDVSIRRAFEAIDKASWTEEQLRTCDKMEKAYFDNLAVEQYKIEVAEAIAEAKGKAKGKIEGVKEGKLEEKLGIARKMLEDKLPLETISKYSELTIKEIKKIL